LNFEEILRVLRNLRNFEVFGILRIESFEVLRIWEDLRISAILKVFGNSEIQKFPGDLKM
jgi:hypothetical protein